jgi:hypothetical protein
MPPVFRWKIIKIQQDIPVFFKTGCCLGVFCFKGLNKGIKALFGFFFIIRHPNLLEFFFGFRLKALWQFI